MTENKDQVEEILEGLPPSSQNNSRSIFLSKVKSFEKSPTDKKRHELEDFGMSIDHDDRTDHMGDHPDFNPNQE